MTPEQFKAWRLSKYKSRREASEALGVAAVTIQLYELGFRRDNNQPVVIPKPVELACAALSAGITSYDGPSTEYIPESG